MKFRGFILTIELQVSICNLGDQLEIQLLDLLIAGVKHSEIQKKLMLKHDPTVAGARLICEHLDNVSDALAERSGVHLQKPQSRPSANPYRQIQKPLANEMSR